MNSEAKGAYSTGFAAIFVLVLAALLTACAAPQRAPRAQLYDFGVPTAAASPAAASQPPLATVVQATPAFDGQAMLYRLAYADAQQLRAYSQARWAMTPAELVQQRLREGLSRQFTVLRPGEGAPRVLQLELEEFSQRFTSPTQSEGVLRLRATVRQAAPAEQRLLAQRSVVLQRPAPSADAAGGVSALAAATDAAVAELAQWLAQLPLR